jgi:hypothetical protein
VESLSVGYEMRNVEHGKGCAEGVSMGSMQYAM